METLPIIILLLLLLFISFKHYEKFIVNPTSFTDIETEKTIEGMRKFRECQKVANYDHCILDLNKKSFHPHIPLEKLPYRRYVNYRLTRRVSDLFPQYKEHRPHI